MLSLLNKFAKSKSGAFLPMFGVVVFPVLTLVMGATVDYARMNNLQSRMQSSSDIALIAATKSIQGIKGDKSGAELNSLLKEEFKPFFQANMKMAGYDNFSFEPSFNEDENRSKVTVTATYEPVFMQMFGFEKIDVAVDLSVNLKVEENYYVIDIVMCLDATGSMQNTLNAAVQNANSFNNDLRKELEMVDDPRMKVRVRPMFYRDWEDATRYSGKSPLDGGTSRTRHNNAAQDVFKYTKNFIDLDPKKISKKPGRVRELKKFLDSENARGGGDLPEAGATCINQGARSKWYKANSSEARKYFNIGKKVPINEPNKPNNANVTVVPVVVFWTDAAISEPWRTRKYIDSTQPDNWPEMKSKVWDNSKFINQKNKILVLFGPNPDPDGAESGYDKAYAYAKRYYPYWSESQLQSWARRYENHPYFSSSSASAGWDEVMKWSGYAYGGSLQDGNQNGAKIIGKKIKEKLPDLMRLSS